LQDEPTVDAKIENLKTVERATTIGEGPVRVHTVEHVLAALWAMGVDNAIVEMDANEPPIGDGSAEAYVELIKKAGVTAQEEPRKFFDVREPMRTWKRKQVRCLSCSRTTNSAFSCTQAGPNNQFTQFLSLEVEPSIFEREIAPARTFVYYEDVEPLMDKNLIKWQPRTRLSCAARRSKQGTIAFLRRIRAAQNPRYYWRSRAGRSAYPRSRGGGETRTCCECGIGSRARS
jgi:UDP-3-O-[3-hydroxymyristoyl] N-acetylglucosamine deacetylase/3-hydroxyacyl-[acyl-carrier-protein] dehydratase